MEKSRHAVSWGRLNSASAVLHPFPTSSQEQAALFSQPDSILPHGYGRSYGDSCLNRSGILVDTTSLGHLIQFDKETGVLRSEAGLSLSSLLTRVIPEGWFLPVLPGTRQVSLAGAIANDIHGKNHHKEGSFGCHVRRFELLRSDNKRYLCSPEENSEYFYATIGGLGLTGFITWVEIQLKRVNSAFLDSEMITMRSLDDFYRLSEESDQHYEYTVSWIDALASNPGKGLFMRANHATDGRKNLRSPLSLSVKVDLPFKVLFRPAMELFNATYFLAKSFRTGKRHEYYEPFFFPLDKIRDWNRLYGKKGFFQYQFVVPLKETEALQRMLELVYRSSTGSYLAVLKRFGSKASGGLLSFPTSGYTLALDFPNRGESTLALFRKMDEIVQKAGGRLYPAKDARMSGESFRSFFPNWKTFSHSIDPKFLSDFWRRVSQ